MHTLPCSNIVTSKTRHEWADTLGCSMKTSLNLLHTSRKLCSWLYSSLGDTPRPDVKAVRNSANTFLATREKTWAQRSFVNNSPGKLSISQSGKESALTGRRGHKGAAGETGWELRCARRKQMANLALSNQRLDMSCCITVLHCVGAEAPTSQELLGVWTLQLQWQGAVAKSRQSSATLQETTRCISQSTTIIFIACTVKHW